VKAGGVKRVYEPVDRTAFTWNLKKQQQPKALAWDYNNLDVPVPLN